MTAILGTMVGLILGAVITWQVSDHYYKKATEDLEVVSQELKSETQEIRRLNKIMLLGMEHAGWIELTKDNSGNIMGFKIKIKGTGIPNDETLGIPTLKQQK